MSFTDKPQSTVNRSSSRIGSSHKSVKSPQFFASDECSPNISELNFTLLGFPAPLRLSRTVAKNKNANMSSTNVSGKAESVAEGAIKLLAKTTALNLGFVNNIDEYSTFNHPYIKMDGESSAQSSYIASNDDESDSSCVSVFESNSSDENCTSNTVSCINSLNTTPIYSPNENTSRTAKITTEEGSYFSRSSSWTTNFESVKSECESASNKIDEVSGEWNNFWRNYNDPKGFDPDKPFIEAAKDSGEISGKRDSQIFQEKKSPQIQKVIMSTTDAIEAARCARRLSEILNSAIRRSSLPSTTKTINERDLEKLNNLKRENDDGVLVVPTPPPLPSPNIMRSKSDSQIKKIQIKDIDLKIKKKELKPVNFDCIEVEIMSTDPNDIAQIFQNVLNKRRDLIQPPDETSMCQSQRSDWSVE